MSTSSQKPGDALVLDQRRIDAPHFPRPRAWWTQYVPCWLSPSIDEQGRVTLAPNGMRADGVQLPVTPSRRRRALRAARKWVSDNPRLACAVVTAEGGESR